MKRKIILKGSVSTIIILAIFFGISLLIQYIFGAHELIPAAFVMAVFLISLTTDGYIWGFIAACISVLAVNYAFTFPYFALNFTIPENTVSAIIMIAVTLITSTLTTKIKKQEAAKVEAEREKMRANLLRAVSHDLRTPLTGIYGASSTALENFSELDDEKKKLMLRGIKEDSEWLIRMVENLLSVTRLDDGRMKLKLTPTVADELIDSALSKFKTRYPTAKVTLKTSEDFLLIPMDAILIEQVLVNLLENAVQHAGEMENIYLSVEREGRLALFSVADDGCGICDKITDGNFSKISTQPDSARGGMGIGLSVCATIVKAHGGTLTARNRAEGGAEFFFSLMISEDEGEELYEQQI